MDKTEGEGCGVSGNVRDVVPVFIFLSDDKIEKRLIWRDFCCVDGMLIHSCVRPCVNQIDRKFEGRAEQFGRVERDVGFQTSTVSSSSVFAEEAESFPEVEEVIMIWLM